MDVTGTCIYELYYSYNIYGVSKACQLWVHVYLTIHINSKRSFSTHRPMQPPNPPAPDQDNWDSDEEEDGLADQSPLDVAW